MEYLVGCCVGGLLVLIFSPIIIPIALFILWGLDFIDMGLHLTTPPWLKRLQERMKRLLSKSNKA